jgi:hypothetical protein
MMMTDADAPAASVDLRLLGVLLARLKERVDWHDLDLLLISDLEEKIAGLDDNVGALETRIIGHLNDLIRGINSNRRTLIDVINDQDRLEQWAAAVAERLGLAQPFSFLSDNSARVRAAGETTPRGAGAPRSFSVKGRASANSSQR